VLFPFCSPDILSEMAHHLPWKVGPTAGGMRYAMPSGRSISHFVFFQQWWNSFPDWTLPVGTGSQIINGTFDLNGQNRRLKHRLKVSTTHYKIAPFESTTEEVSFEYFTHRLKVRTILHFYTIDWEWANSEAVSQEAYVWCSESCNVSYHSDSLSHKKSTYSF